MDALYLQLAPLPRHLGFVRHLYVLHDRGLLAHGEGSRFSQPCRDIGVVCRQRPSADEPATASWQVHDEPPRFGRAPRARPFHGWAFGILCNPLTVGPALDPSAALRALQHAVMKELQAGDAPLHGLIHALDACVERLASHGLLAEPRVDGGNASLRTVQRRMKASVGLGPKRWNSLWRFEDALRRVAGGEALADVAFAAGYADQAHMTTDFARHTGTSPARLRAATRSLTVDDIGDLLLDPALIARVQCVVRPPADQAT